MKNCLPNLNPNGFTSSAILIAFLFIDDLTINEQDAIGEWFMLIGQILATHAAQRSVLEERKEKAKNFDLDTLQKTLEKVTKEIETLKKENHCKHNAKQ